MAAKDFTEYVLEKADNVIDIASELEFELTSVDGLVDAFIDEAVAAYHDYLTDLALRIAN